MAKLDARWTHILYVGSVVMMAFLIDLIMTIMAIVDLAKEVERTQREEIRNSFSILAKVIVVCFSCVNIVLESLSFSLILRSTKLKQPKVLKVGTILLVISWCLTAVSFCLEAIGCGFIMDTIWRCCLAVCILVCAVILSRYWKSLRADVVTNERSALVSSARAKSSSAPHSAPAPPIYISSDIPKDDERPQNVYDAYWRQLIAPQIFVTFPNVQSGPGSYMQARPITMQYAPQPMIEMKPLARTSENL